MIFKKVLNAIHKAIRAIKIWAAVLSLIVLLWWDSCKWNYIGGFTKSNKLYREQLRATWLTSKLINLGSAFIKIGQLLSARPDVLPSGWVVELANLQDKVPPFSFLTARDLLKKELNERFFDIYDLESEPIGAASLAQVHLAKLKNGREIVLKIQRPGLEKVFRLDLEIMQQVAFVLQKHPRWSQG